MSPRDPDPVMLAEQSTLGALLIEPGRLAEVAGIVAPRDFRDPAHAVAFSSMLALAAEGVPVDLVAVYSKGAATGATLDLAYLNDLSACVPTARNVTVHARTVADAAQRRRFADAAQRIAREAELPGADLGALARDLGDLGRPTAPAVARVDLSRVGAGGPPRPPCVIAEVLPRGVVTLFGAHGEGGKSTLALMQAVCVAFGLPWLGMPTEAARVLVFSAEDSEQVVIDRLGWICAELGADPAQLPGLVRVLDFSDRDAALFRNGESTRALDLLCAEAEDFDPGLIIVDNASDTFDDDEIRRARVRAFVRALAQLARPKAKPVRAVELLGHVDKSTARGTLGRNGEGYSGSTAWHNSVRSRLFLRREDDGALTLEHQKSQYGVKREPMRLIWPRDRLPQLDRPLSAVVQGIADRNDMRALLKLVHEYADRGESVPTSTSGPATAAQLFGREPACPRVKPAELFGLLRDAERRGYLSREHYRNAARKPRERWSLTPAGVGLFGPSAPVAPVAPVDATGATSQQAQTGAPVAPVTAGGCGGGEHPQDRREHAAAGPRSEACREAQAPGEPMANPRRTGEPRAES